MTATDYEKWVKRNRRLIDKYKISREELQWAAERYPEMTMGEYRKQKAEGKIRYEKTSPMDIPQE